MHSKAKYSVGSKLDFFVSKESVSQSKDQYISLLYRPIHQNPSNLELFWTLWRDEWLKYSLNTKTFTLRIKLIEKIELVRIRSNEFVYVAIAPFAWSHCSLYYVALHYVALHNLPTLCSLHYGAYTIYPALSSLHYITCTMQPTLCSLHYVASTYVAGTNRIWT